MACPAFPVEQQSDVHAPCPPPPTPSLLQVKDLPFEVIANGHGPLLRYNVPELVGRWAGGQAWGSRDTARCSSAAEAPPQWSACR